MEKVNVVISGYQDGSKEEIVASKKSYLSKKSQLVFNHIKKFAKTAAVKKWIDGNLYNYILKKYPGTPIFSEESDSPDWVKSFFTYSKNPSASVFRIEYSTIRRDIKKFVAWIKYLNTLHASDLSTLSPEKIEERVVKAKGVAIVLPLDNGFHWVQLLTEEACLLEGKVMNNCMKLHAPHIVNGEEDVFSLRDTNENPHIDVAIRVKDRLITEIKGNANGIVKDEYTDYLLELLNSGKISAKSILTRELRFGRIRKDGDKFVKLPKVSFDSAVKEFTVFYINDYPVCKYEDTYYVVFLESKYKKTESDYNNDFIELFETHSILSLYVKGEDCSLQQQRLFYDFLYAEKYEIVYNLLERLGVGGYISLSDCLRFRMYYSSKNNRILPLKTLRDLSILVQYQMKKDGLITREIREGNSFLWWVRLPPKCSVSHSGTQYLLDPTNKDFYTRILEDTSLCQAIKNGSYLKVENCYDPTKIFVSSLNGEEGFGRYIKYLLKDDFIQQMSKTALLNIGYVKESDDSSELIPISEIPESLLWQYKKEMVDNLKKNGSIENYIVKDGHTYALRKKIIHRQSNDEALLYGSNFFEMISIDSGASLADFESGTITIHAFKEDVLPLAKVLFSLINGVVDCVGTATSIPVLYLAPGSFHEEAFLGLNFIQTGGKGWKLKNNLVFMEV